MGEDVGQTQVLFSSLSEFNLLIDFSTENRPNSNDLNLRKAKANLLEAFFDFDGDLLDRAFSFFFRFGSYRENMA